MALYIVCSSDISAISKEINEVLVKDENRMLIYYTRNGPAFPDIVLDYISDESIKIKRLPAPVDKCETILAYEIGRLHAEESKTEFILWGRDIFRRIYNQLIEFDSNIRTKISFNEITGVRDRTEHPIASAHENVSKDSAVKNGKAVFEEQNRKRKEKLKSQQENDNQQASRNQDAEKKQQNRKKAETSQEKLDKEIKPKTKKSNLSKPDLPEDNASGRKNESVIMDQLTGNSNSKPADKAAKNEETEVKNDLEGIKEKEKTTMAISDKVSDKDLSDFQELLKKISGGETPTENQTCNVMLAVMDCKEVTDKKLVQDIYKDKLKLYFASKRRSDYFYKYTKEHLNELMEFFNKNM